MDFTSPIGKVILATLAAFAQYCSDNLATEVSKGKRERKARALFNGLRPFGMMPGRGGPASASVAGTQASCVLHWTEREGGRVVDGGRETTNFAGLRLAFTLAAEGRTDREIADALDGAGYLTTGNRGRNLFAKDTVRAMLRNRFYLGDLPDGRGDWIAHDPERQNWRGHAPVLDAELFERAQQGRSANRKSVAKVRSGARRYSLTGLAVCACGGPMHIQSDPNGKPRILCYRGRQLPSACAQRSQFLEPLEEQLGAYLATFRLDEETVERVVKLHERASSERDDAEHQRRELAGRLERIRKSYEWGHKPEAEYVAERHQIERVVGALRATAAKSDVLAKTAAFLRDLPAGWREADQGQKNALASLVFRSVEVSGDRVSAVVVQPDRAPFFAVQQNTPAELTGVSSLSVGSSGSDGDSSSVRYTAPVPLRYLALEACPAVRYPTARRRADARIEPAELANPVAGASLRAKARRLGVSHEAVRQAMIAVGTPTAMLTRNQRIRALAEQNVPWPAIAAAFDPSPSAVRRVCRDVPPRRAGPKPGARAGDADGPASDP